MRLLLIEDTALKRESVLDFLRSRFPDADFAIARSMSGGRSLIAGATPDIIVLDMSLPVFDVETTESGFRHLSYGGMDVLESLYQQRSSIPVIVLTAFSQFGEGKTAKTLEQLDRELLLEFPDNYRGFVSYSSVDDGWQEELALKILNSLRL